MGPTDLCGLWTTVETWYTSHSYLRGMYSFELGLLFFLRCIRLGVYTVIIAGWYSNSNYSLLEGLRAVAQTISYEVRLALILLSFVFLVGRYDLINFYYFQCYLWLIFITVPLSLVWFTSCLAETNRTPFDSAEGESELVSGFNVEYSRGGFALIFFSWICKYSVYKNIILCNFLRVWY